MFMYRTHKFERVGGCNTNSVTEGHQAYCCYIWKDSQVGQCCVLYGMGLPGGAVKFCFSNWTVLVFMALSPIPWIFIGDVFMSEENFKSRSDTPFCLWVWWSILLVKHHIQEKENCIFLRPSSCQFLLMYWICFYHILPRIPNYYYRRQELFESFCGGHFLQFGFGNWYFMRGKWLLHVSISEVGMDKKSALNILYFLWQSFVAYYDVEMWFQESLCIGPFVQFLWRWFLE